MARFATATPGCARHILTSASLMMTAQMANPAIRSPTLASLVAQQNASQMRIASVDLFATPSSASVSLAHQPDARPMTSAPLGRPAMLISISARARLQAVLPTVTVLVMRSVSRKPILANPTDRRRPARATLTAPRVRVAMLILVSASLRYPIFVTQMMTVHRVRSAILRLGAVSLHRQATATQMTTIQLARFVTKMKALA